MAKQKQFLPFRLSDGSIVQIQYIPAQTGEEEVGIFDKTFSFEEVSKKIGVLASDLGNAMKAVQPSKLAIEFGIDLDVDSTTGLLSLLVSGSASGSIKITLEWEKPDPK